MTKQIEWKNVHEMRAKTQMHSTHRNSYTHMHLKSIRLCPAAKNEFIRVKANGHLEMIINSSHSEVEKAVIIIK